MTTHKSKVSKKNHPAPRHAKRKDRIASLCQMLVADGVISQMESEVLLQWLSADRLDDENDNLSRVDELISKQVIDGAIGDEERRELLKRFEKLT